MSALKEATLEMLRVVLMAVIPVAITGIESDVIDWRVLGTAAAIAALRFIDKYLHLLGKERGNASLTKGLTRF